MFVQATDYQTFFYSPRIRAQTVSSLYLILTVCDSVVCYMIPVWIWSGCSGPAGSGLLRGRDQSYAYTMENMKTFLSCWLYGEGIDEIPADSIINICSHFTVSANQSTAVHLCWRIHQKWRTNWSWVGV